MTDSNNIQLHWDQQPYKQYPVTSKSHRNNVKSGHYYSIYLRRSLSDDSHLSINFCFVSRSDASVRGRKRSFSDGSSDDDDDDVQQRQVVRKKPRQESTVTPLDTGLSLAEDEELVLHLLGGHS